MPEIIEVCTVFDLYGAVDKHDKALVEFGAIWCAPCRATLPHLKKFAAMQNDIAVIKVDIDGDSGFMTEFGIQSVPQLMLFENGKFSRHVAGRTIIQLQNELL